MATHSLFVSVEHLRLQWKVPCYQGQGHIKLRVKKNHASFSHSLCEVCLLYNKMEVDYSLKRSTGNLLYMYYLNWSTFVAISKAFQDLLFYQKKNQKNTCFLYNKHYFLPYFHLICLTLYISCMRNKGRHCVHRETVFIAAMCMSL